MEIQDEYRPAVRRRLIHLIIILLLFVMVCLFGPLPLRFAAPAITGYVMDIDENGRVLVVEPILKGDDKRYSALWLFDVDMDIELGQKVKAWFDWYASSYPGLTSPYKIKIVRSKKPRGANLTEAEVLGKALADLPSEQRLRVVSSIEFDPQNSRWIIVYKTVENNYLYTVVIDD